MCLGCWLFPLADFGLARVLEPNVLAKTWCGTFHYMAPEVFLGGRYGSMADLWSLGAIIYECVVGHPLHQGKSFPQLAKLYQNDTELLLT